MSTQVEEVKQKTDIVSIIGEKVTLKRAGRHFKGLCPFHAEKSPSFMVSPELQIYKCFGCGEAGDVFSFLEKYEGMDFPESLTFLADRAGVKLEKGHFETDQKSKLYEINALTAKFYNYILVNHKAGRAALTYLTEKRGIKLDTIGKFNLGYSPFAYGALESFLIKKKKYKLADIESAGIGYDKGGRLVDRFTGRIIFPLQDHRGNVVAFAGRILPDDARTDIGKYINSPETEIYHKSKILFGLNTNKEEIKRAGKVVIVEGELDMIASYQAGIRNVVAIKGSALTLEQLTLLKRFADGLVLALDADFAGAQAAKRGIATAHEMGFDIKVAKMGDYKDPDEFARNNPSGYKNALDEAEGVWDFLFNLAFEKADPTTSEGKAKINRELIPTLASIPDRIIQAHFIEKASEKLNVPSSAVADEVERHLGGRPKEREEKKVAVEKEVVRGRREALEERLLALAISSHSKFFGEKEVEDLFVSPFPKRLFEVSREYSEKVETFNYQDLAKVIPPELYEGFAKLILSVEEDEIDAQKVEMETLKKELVKLKLKEELDAQTAVIKGLEGGENPEKLVEAQKLFSQISTKLADLL